MTCSQCNWWGGEDPQKDGVCRGAPPVPIQMRTMEETIAGVKVHSSVNSYFPVTKGTTPACGAFEMREAKA